MCISDYLLHLKSSQYNLRGHDLLTLPRVKFIAYGGRELPVYAIPYQTS